MTEETKMRTYLLAPVSAALPALSGREFDPAREPFCLEREYAPIDQFVWDESGYCPEARAYVGWEDDGFCALLCAKEREIAATVTEFNGRVCCDSCLEWFFKPFADDPRYLNIEVNPRGVALIGFGASRAERSNLPSLPEGMDIRASEHRGGWWAVAYRVPNALLRALYGRAPVPGEAMAGNFYKCDESIHPHFGSWNAVVWPKPDFHRPECFGAIGWQGVNRA